VASLSQGRTAAAQCGLFTHKSVPVIFEPPCRSVHKGKHQTEWWWWSLLSNRILNVIFHIDMLRIASDAGNYIFLLLVLNCQF